jgi:hypothetical protein
VGGIWEVQDSFVLDAGLRGARVGDVSAEEIRLGFTWSLPIWEAAVPSEARAAARVHRAM